MLTGLSCRIPDDGIDPKRYPLFMAQVVLQELIESPAMDSGSQAMLIALHKNARTTPAVRAEIAASNETASVLAQRFGITDQTVYKWKKRDVFGDRSHTAHRLQTVLTPAQESVVLHLRRTLLLPLDDLLAVTREFICADVSRSGLDRCLRRHGAGNLNDLKPREPCCRPQGLQELRARLCAHGCEVPCPRCRTNRNGAICSWPSTGPPAGCSCSAKPTRQRPMQRPF